MKKLLFFAILALFMCSCEEKTGYGCIDVYNYTDASLFVDVYNMKGELCYQRVANESYIYFIVPTGTYKIIASSYLPYPKKRERTCTVLDNQTTTLTFY